jgi:hypothetical protein
MVYKINPNYMLFNHGDKRTMTEESEIFCEQIGQIELPSGQLVACDPFIGMEEVPFTKHVKPGKYPVLVNILRYKNDDERVAYAMIKFSNNEVTTWDMALQEGQKINELEDDEFFGYGVDSGTGSFMDTETLNVLLAYEEERQNENSEYYIYLEFENELNETYKDTRSWLVTTINNKASISMFSTGWGDGLYPSFWGLDENGEVVYLVTDFLITD